MVRYTSIILLLFSFLCYAKQDTIVINNAEKIIVIAEDSIYVIDTPGKLIKYNKIIHFYWEGDKFIDSLQSVITDLRKRKRVEPIRSVK